MTPRELFKLKEKLLRELNERVESETFVSEEEKHLTHNSSMEAIMEFYRKAMIVMIDEAA